MENDWGLEGGASDAGECDLPGSCVVWLGEGGGGFGDEFFGLGENVVVSGVLGEVVLFGGVFVEVVEFHVLTGELEGFPGSEAEGAGVDLAGF